MFKAKIAICRLPGFLHPIPPHTAGLPSAQPPVLPGTPFSQPSRPQEQLCSRSRRPCRPRRLAVGAGPCGVQSPGALTLHTSLEHSGTFVENGAKQAPAECTRGALSREAAACTEHRPGLHCSMRSGSSSPSWFPSPPEGYGTPKTLP